jgi:hypothetical protein
VISLFIRQEESSHGPPVALLLVLAGYAAVFGFLARRFFRWE